MELVSNEFVHICRKNSTYHLKTQSIYVHLLNANWRFCYFCFISYSFFGEILEIFLELFVTATLTRLFIFNYLFFFHVHIFVGYVNGLRRFELRGPLVIWNSALAIFSIIGASRTAPELIHVLRHYGLFHSVCDPRLV